MSSFKIWFRLVQNLGKIIESDNPKKDQELLANDYPNLQLD